MLAIRMQRTGRKGHAQFRVIVQDSRRSPSTGNIVEYLGSYDPHTKVASLKKESIEKYLSTGAQPSNRVAILLKKEGVALPKWVNIDTSGKRSLKNPEKLRRNRPDEPKEEKPADEPSEPVVEESKSADETEQKPEVQEKEEPKEEKEVAPKEKKETTEPTENKDEPKKEEKTVKPE